MEHPSLALQAPTHGDMGDLAGVNVLAKELVGYSKLVRSFVQCEQFFHNYCTSI
jgi:hypothetical protein